MNDNAFNLVQFVDVDGGRALALVSNDGRQLRLLDGVETTLDLAAEADGTGERLCEAAARRLGTRTADYGAVVAEGRLLAPIDHPEPARLHVTGTGLTHLGSASTRDAMHAAASAGPETDSMRMFRLGLDGGRPAQGAVGAQPEWFYKGNGHTVVAPEAPLVSPAFAEDGGEEPELALVYWIDGHGVPRRLGAALGNEFSDHVTEKGNYLWLAHSKLRQSSFGPELRLGDVPADIRGVSRIVRDGEAIWEKPFATGEDNMSHTIANLEHHHFKYAHNRRPGDVHVHFLGTATLSFADGVRAQDGDVFEIEAPGFGRPLRNPLSREADASGTHAAKPL